MWNNKEIESKDFIKIISYNMSFEIGGTNTVVSISKKITNMFRILSLRKPKNLKSLSEGTLSNFSPLFKRYCLFFLEKRVHLDFSFKK